MANIQSEENNLPIDVVIAWVDGNDPKLAAKRQLHIKGPIKSTQSGAHPTRFASINEVRYCVLSILRFAPFVRNIFIVTDGQDPNLYDDIRTYFPDRLNSVRIVDHTEIFEGFEKYLPTFNSISIGNMIWRIKGLSDRFVYFNDDLFLVRSMRPEDWFIGHQPVLRGSWAVAPYYRMLWDGLRIGVNRYLLGNPQYEPRASFHLGQWNSASALGFWLRYLSNGHTPHTVNRKVLETFFLSHLPLFERNISYRFRHPAQFTIIALSNHLQLLSGNNHIAKPSLAYLHPYKRPSNYIDRKIQKCENDSKIKYLCVQSLEMCPKGDQDKIFGWLNARLGLT